MTALDTILHQGGRTTAPNIRVSRGATPVLSVCDMFPGLRHRMHDVYIHAGSLIRDRVLVYLDFSESRIQVAVAPGRH